MHKENALGIKTYFQKEEKNEKETCKRIVVCDFGGCHGGRVRIIRFRFYIVLRQYVRQ